MLGKAIVVICQKSRPSFTMIWCSGGSVRRSANKEFPTLHNHRFPLGKLRFTALKCISSAAYSPHSSGPPPFSRYPKTPSPHRTRLPSLSPCLSSLAFLSPPPPFLHPSLPCSSQPVSDFLQPPCRRCPCLHMLFCNM